MQLIETIKRKQQARHLQLVQQQAENFITLTVFGGTIYIACANTPLIPIDDSLTSKDIVSEITKIRQNYVNSKIQQS